MTIGAFLSIGWASPKKLFSRECNLSGPFSNSVTHPFIAMISASPTATLSRCWIVPAMMSLLIFLAPTLAKAGLEEIVGTWRRPDKSFVEFREGGAVITRDIQVGSWQRLRDTKKYVVNMKGALGYFFHTQVVSYQRKLSMKHSTNGVETVMDRVDSGPTTNPDVHTERSALEAEFADLEDDWQNSALRLQVLLEEAAVARQKHDVARALGKISAHLVTAQQKEDAARGTEAHIRSITKRLSVLEPILGKKARAPTLSAVPPPGAGSGFGPGGMPGGFPPGFVPPGFVPGRGLPPQPVRR